MQLVLTGDIVGRFEVAPLDDDDKESAHPLTPHRPSCIGRKNETMSYWVGWLAYWWIIDGSKRWKTTE